MEEVDEFLKLLEYQRIHNSEEEFLRESNKIEGIQRGPNEPEFKAFKKFIKLKKITIPDLVKLVEVFQPGAKLRTRPGMDVRVGNYIAPKGGELISYYLQNLLDKVNTKKIDAWAAHIEYEKLHPFIDGNGRSGRMLWWWMQGGSRLGFLHQFYYQTLANAEKK